MDIGMCACMLNACTKLWMEVVCSVWLTWIWHARVEVRFMFKFLGDDVYLRFKHGGNRYILVFPSRHAYEVTCARFGHLWCGWKYINENFVVVDMCTNPMDKWLARIHSGLLIKHGDCCRWDSPLKSLNLGLLLLSLHKRMCQRKIGWFEIREENVLLFCDFSSMLYRNFWSLCFVDAGMVMQLWWRTLRGDGGILFSSRYGQCLVLECDFSEFILLEFWILPNFMFDPALSHGSNVVIRVIESVSCLSLPFVDYASKLGLIFILVSQNNRLHVGILKNQRNIEFHVLLRSDYDFIWAFLIFLENLASNFMRFSTVFLRRP